MKRGFVEMETGLEKNITSDASLSLMMGSMMENGAIQERRYKSPLS
jgi:hypothetical protein